MSKFNQTKFSDLINYQGRSSKNLKNFLRKVQKNQRNSINILDTIDKQRNSIGICLRLEEFRELKKIRKETEIIQEEPQNPNEIQSIPENSKYYIRYFLNMYNIKTKKMYGNTYQSPFLEIKFEGDNEIRLLQLKPFYAYFLSPDPENDAVIIQFVITETDGEDISNIKSQISERWTILLLNQINKNAQNKQNNEEKELNIFKGSPRYLLYNDYDKVAIGHDCGIEGYLIYSCYKMPQLEEIKFLLPDYIILSEGEILPGLGDCFIGPEHNFEELTKFETVYIKNIIISINPKLEKRILEFANKYREKKYNITSENYNKYNNVYIKERKLKCGVHNTWCFINTNGLENSVTLTKKENENDITLNYQGILTVDHFFVEESLSGLILELDYIVTIPIIENHKEENLTLPIGYSIFIPENIEEDDQLKKANFITGQTETVYGEKLWFSPDFTDRLIELVFTMSKNPELIRENYQNFELEENKELLRQAKENYINQSNLIIKGVENEEQRLKNLEYEKKIKILEDKVKEGEEKQREMLNKQKELNQQEPKQIIKYIPKPMPGEPQVQKIEDELTEEKKIELNKNIDLFQSFEKLDKNLDEYRNNSQIIYDEKLKNLELDQDFYSMTSLGEKYLALPEIQESIIEYNLHKELESNNFGNLINFQFLSFKPSKLFYKNINNIPKKIKFKTNFFDKRNLTTCICDISLPGSNSKENLYYFGTPLILTKENSWLNSASKLNDGDNKPNSDKEIKIEIKYDPSTDKSLDFRDFVKFLSSKYLVVEIIDVEKGFNIGQFKIPLNDLLRKGKDKVYLTKEFPIYDDDFVLKGYIQMLLENKEFNTMNNFSYNRSAYRKIEAKNNLNNSKKKKKVLASKINLKNYKNINDISKEDDQGEKLMKFKTDLEIKKQIQVTRFLSTMEGNKFNQNMINELKLKEMKQKQLLEEQLTQTKIIRAEMKPGILSKVTHEVYKSEFNISLIQGQPLYFNYNIFNDSDKEELYNIIIDKVNKPKEESNKENAQEKKEIVNEGNTVSVVNIPEEWARIVSFEKLDIPKDYNIFSNDLFFSMKPNEHIPILIKLLSYWENFGDEEYNLYINKKNGRTHFLLNIKIHNTFPIYDHIFHYHLPCNSYQDIILVNPFKSSQKKTMEILNYYQSTDIQVNLAQEKDNKEFVFKYNTNEEGFVHEFLIFLYSDEFKNNLYLTWKFEIYCHEVISMDGSLGKKNICPLYINYIEKNKIPVNNLDNKLVLQLYSDRPETIQFGEGYDVPFDLIQNSTAESKFILYPKNKNRNNALINCININTRELYKSWLIQYTCANAVVSDEKNIECYVGSQTNIKYECTNPIDKWVLLRFESSDDNLMYVVDNVVPFNGKEEKYINIIIPRQIHKRKFDAFLFISDEREEYSKTIVFHINFK